MKPQGLMNQSFVSTALLTTWMGGDNDFHFQSPGISTDLWGQADGSNPALCPAHYNRKSQRGTCKCPDIITPALPRHCGDYQKVFAQHLIHG